MTNTLIFPILAMMLITFLVWLLMYRRRIAFIIKNRIHPESLKTQPDLEAQIPAEVQYAAYNLRNLFELPVLFYALCLLLEHRGMVTTIDVVLAWLFVLGRAAHSAIHCTSNRVMHRFRAYAFSSITLWVMVFYAALRVIYGALL